MRAGVLTGFTGLAQCQNCQNRCFPGCLGRVFVKTNRNGVFSCFTGLPTLTTQFLSFLLVLTKTRVPEGESKPLCREPPKPENTEQ